MRGAAPTAHSATTSGVSTPVVAWGTARSSPTVVIWTHPVGASPGGTRTASAEGVVVHAGVQVDFPGRFFLVAVVQCLDVRVLEVSHVG